MTTPAKSTLLNGRHGRAAAIEIAPGKPVADLPPKHVARYIVAELIPTGEPSTYRAVAKVKDVNLRVTGELTRQLGLGVRSDTLRRLIRAGFVGGGRIAPNCYVVDLESWFAHVERVKASAEAGEDFWTGENLSRYRAAI